LDGAGGPELCVPTVSGFNADNVSWPPAADTPAGKKGAIPGGTQSPEFYFDISSGLTKTLKHSYNVTDYPITAFNAARVSTVHTRFAAASNVNVWGPILTLTECL